MSLYDGLDMEEKGGGTQEKKPDVSGWGSSLKLMETTKQLQAKKASLLNLRKRQPTTTVAPVIDLNKRNDEASSLQFNMQTGKLVSIPAAASPFIASDAPSSLTGVTDEYDPLRPNDYDDFAKRRKKEREKEKKKEEEERPDYSRMSKMSSSESNSRRRKRPQADNSDDEGEFERRRKEREREREREEEEEAYERPRRTGGAAIAPPQSLLEDQGPPPNEEGPTGAFRPMGIDPGYGLRDRSSIASKIMAKMGYKEGSGLGKSEQGMSTALLVEKTSKRGGKIIHERDLPKGSPVPETPRAEVSNANLLKNPSKVLLLRNMVGPGEVDGELEPETAEECQKYGKVIKCVIFEIPNVTEDEAVRIFVEFEKQESAIKAVVDLNGRFFGGRVVKGSFYNLDRFRQLHLGGPVD